MCVCVCVCVCVCMYVCMCVYMLELAWRSGCVMDCHAMTRASVGTV